MTDFLIRHKFDEEAVLGCETSSLKFLDGEFGQAIVEKVELDPLLVQSESLVMFSQARCHVKMIPTNDSKSKSLLAL